MKIKTKRQRAELYLVAAQIIDGQDFELFLKKTDKNVDFLTSPFCCDILCGLSDLGNYNCVTKETFPEFYMFEHQDKREGFTGWWGDDDKQTRVIALLLASEIARH